MGGGRTAPDWTDAEDEWLREFYPAMQNHELAEFKALDGWPRDERAIYRRARKLGLRKDPSRGYVRRCRMPTAWTPERDAWFREFVPGHTEREISAEHERLFGTPLTEGQIGNHKTKLGIRSGTHGGRFEKGSVPANKGRTWDEMGIGAESRERMSAGWFAKGHRPHNEGELLDERVDKDGFVQVKVDPRNAANTMRMWIGKGQFVWMQHNGRDWPERCRCVFADRDRRNFDPDNIVPVPNDLYPIVCGAVRGQVGYHDRESLEVAIASAMVTRKRAELAAKARKRRK